MKPEPGYEVGFSKHARNLFYKDSQGVLHFTFDVDTARKPTRVILDTTPLAEDFRMIELSNLTQAEQLQIKLAGEKVKQYLITCGYEVKDLPEIRNAIMEGEKQ
jgi:hypothetical protein